MVDVVMSGRGELSNAADLVDAVADNFAVSEHFGPLFPAAKVLDKSPDSLDVTINDGSVVVGRLGGFIGEVKIGHFCREEDVGEKIK